MSGAYLVRVVFAPADPDVRNRPMYLLGRDARIRFWLGWACTYFTHLAAKFARADATAAVLELDHHIGRGLLALEVVEVEA